MKFLDVSFIVLVVFVVIVFIINILFVEHKPTVELQRFSHGRIPRI